MYVVYESIDYEGDWCHRYFHSYEKAKAYKEKLEETFALTMSIDIILDEITFEDEEETQ